MTAARRSWRRPALVAGMLALLVLAAAVVLGSSHREAAPIDPPLVLAAASLQESLGAVADAWAAAGHARPVLSFAGSSALARQIAAGAPADMFISADEAWMDDLETRGLLAPGTRVDLLANRLVLVAPRDSEVAIDLRRGAPLAAALGEGRLAIAEPDAVPAGRYGKAALHSLGLWDGVADCLARAENVRAALALVERGAAPLGVVYATDAKASAEVRVVAVFPAGSHPPILYPMARLKTMGSIDAGPFRQFLASREALAIFERYGFSAP